MSKYGDRLLIKIFVSIHFLLIYNVCVRKYIVSCYLGEIGIDSQLGQRGTDGVAGVRHGSVGAGGVGQGVGQRGTLSRETGLKSPCPLLKHLQRGADVLQGLFGLPHSCKQEEGLHI